MLIPPAYLSSFSTWNSRLEQSCFTPVVLAFHWRHPNFQRVQILWSSNFGSPWKTTEWLHTQENQKPRQRVMLQRTEFIWSQTLLILCARRREEHKCYMCDGLFYTKGQIFELNVTTASGLGQPCSLWFMGGRVLNGCRGSAFCSRKHWTQQLHPAQHQNRFHHSSFLEVSLGNIHTLNIMQCPRSYDEGWVSVLYSRLRAVPQNWEKRRAAALLALPIAH